MGAYMYCEKCGYGLPAPYDMTAEVMLHYLFETRVGIKCMGCGSDTFYDKEDFITELAERIDK